jgi:hypothetical protein
MLSSPRIVIGGAAEGGKRPVEGKLILSFDFAGGGGRRYRKPASPQAVQIEQMHREIKAMTPEEREHMAKRFLQAYMLRVNSFTAGRRRIRTS